MRPIERRLGEVAEVMAGMTGLGDVGNYRYGVVQPNSFSDTGTIGAVEWQKRNDEVSEKQKLMVGDILVKRLNPSFVHVVDLETVGMVASQNLLVVRPGGDVDPHYLGYLLEQKEILGQVEHVTGSAAAIKAVSVKKLAGITIPIIPIVEQQKYMAENDRLVSMLASKIISGGGKEK